MTPRDGSPGHEPRAPTRDSLHPFISKPHTVHTTIHTVTHVQRRGVTPLDADRDRIKNLADRDRIKNLADSSAVCTVTTTVCNIPNVATASRLSESVIYRMCLHCFQ